MNRKIDFLINDKKNIYLLVFICSFVVFLLLNRGTYSTDDEEEDLFSFTCPETVKIGDAFECSVSLKIVDNIKEINAKYNMTEGLEFVSFVSDYFEDIDSENNSFILVNETGVTGEIIVGKLTYKIPDTASADDIYTIELSEISVGDGEDTVINFDNQSSSVRVLSNVNTLENITVNGVSVEEFDKTKIEYEIFITDEKATIEVTKSNNGATVTGDGEKEVHYGTNRFEIVVTSEDGNSMTYVVNAYREYEFKSEHYVYNEDKNYLYTADDSNSDVIINNLDLDEGLSAVVKNGELVISFGEEILKKIKVICVSSELYTLGKDYIYIRNNKFDSSKVSVVNANASLDLNGDIFYVIYDGEILGQYDIISFSFKNMVIEENSLTLKKSILYGMFLNDLSVSNRIDIKLFDADDVEITDETLSVKNGMKLKFYCGDNLIDLYNINVFNFEISDKLNIEENFIRYIKPKTLVSNIIDEVDVLNGSVFIFDSNNNSKSSDDLIATGDKLIIYFNGEVVDEYVLSVVGDINGDKELDLLDLVMMRKKLVLMYGEDNNENDKMTFYALDMNRDNEVDLIDLVMMRKAIVGIDIYEEN